MPSRRLLVIELVIVLALTLGLGIYAWSGLIGAATASPGGLSAQTTTMHGSYAPSQPWLDLTLQQCSASSLPSYREHWSATCSSGRVRACGTCGSAGTGR